MWNKNLSLCEVCLYSINIIGNGKFSKKLKFSYVYSILLFSFHKYNENPINIILFCHFLLASGGSSREEML